MFNVQCSKYSAIYSPPFRGGVGGEAVPVFSPLPQISAVLPPCSSLLLPFGEAGRGCFLCHPTEIASALLLSIFSCCKAARISLPASAFVPKHYARPFPHARCIVHKYDWTLPVSIGKNLHIASRYNQAQCLTAHRSLIFFCTFVISILSAIRLTDSVCPLL